MEEHSKILNNLQVLEMKKQSCYLQSSSSGLDERGSWSGEFGDLSAKIEMHTADMQRNVLRMLEKSLAKEMELEKKLSESRNTEYELFMKVYSAEQDVYYMNEVVEDAYLRWLEADNASEFFKGMSKEMSGKLHVLSFNLSESFKRENVLKSELVDSEERLEAKEKTLQKLDSSNARLYDFLVSQTDGLKESLKEAENKLILLNTENSELSEKVSSLEEQLNEYELQTEDVAAASGALVTDLERINEELIDKLAKTEARAEEAEFKCKTLEESIKELQDELGTFRAKGFTPEKLASLEKHLKESDLQLEHAFASVEANKERQYLLYSTVADMEDVIEDLKSKVLKAETRSDYTEEKLIILSESNAELNKELTDKLAKTEARAEEAESKCKTLEESKKELQAELGTFRAKGFTLENLSSLEKHLRESDLQLEHAVAAVEASKEKQNLLYSTVADMEDVIEDLKSKVIFLKEGLTEK